MSHGYGYRSEQRLRKENQDHLGVFQLDDRLVLVVCDGMGGHVGGRQASAIAVRTLHDHFVEHGVTRDQLSPAIEAANLAIFEAARRNYRLMGMGTTCVAAIIEGSTAHIAHVGDSRCYLVRDGTARTVTRDHTMVNLFVDAELLSPEDAATHPEGHVLSRCLGIERAVEVEVSPPITLDPHTALLLCSDGISGVVSDALLASTDWSTPQRSVDAVLEVVASKKGDDNATLVAYCGTSSESPPPPTPPPDLSQLEAAANEAQVVMDDITGPRPVPNVGSWEPEEDVAVIEEVDDLAAETKAAHAARRKAAASPAPAAPKASGKRPVVLAAVLGAVLIAATGVLAMQLVLPPGPPPGGVASSPSEPRRVQPRPTAPAASDDAALATAPQRAEPTPPEPPSVAPASSTPTTTPPVERDPSEPTTTSTPEVASPPTDPTIADPADGPSPTASKARVTTAGLPILTVPDDLALRTQGTATAAVWRIAAQVLPAEPWVLLPSVHDPSVVIPYFQLELPEGPRRLPHVSGSYDKAPPRGPRQVEAIRAVREGRCDEGYALVRDAISDSVDHAGLFRPVWDCWTNTHQQPLVALRADSWSDLRALLIHLDGSSPSSAPRAHSDTARGGINRRVDLLQTSDGAPSLKEVLVDLMGPAVLADHVGVDLLIMASVAVAVARDSRPPADAIATWARQLYQTQVAMQGPLGKLLKEHRPDLATRIDALLFEASGGDATAAQVARRERITSVPTPVARAYADATGVRSIDEVKAEAAARANAAARARAQALDARKREEEQARQEAERTPGIKVYRFEKPSERPSAGRE